MSQLVLGGSYRQRAENRGINEFLTRKKIKRGNTERKESWGKRQKVKKKRDRLPYAPRHQGRKCKRKQTLRVLSLSTRSKTLDSCQGGPPQIRKLEGRMQERQDAKLPLETQNWAKKGGRD